MTGLLTNRLKWAYCDWLTPLWTHKKGEKAEMSGWKRLEDHIDYCHPDIYAFIEQQKVDGYESEE